MWLEGSLEKALPPSTKMVFLGVLFDTVNLTLSVTPERLSEISLLVSEWLFKNRCCLRELQSLLGKLHFVSACVKPGRLFVSRLLIWLRTFQGNDRLRKKIPAFVKKDLVWWDKFLDVYNGVSMMNFRDWSEPDLHLSSDACLVGCGGIAGNQFFHALFPKFIVKKQLHINALELLSIVVCLKLWAEFFRGLKLLIYCDNASSVTVLNTGACRNTFMQSCLREICFISATYEFEIKGQHVPSEENRLADLLSRWSLDVSFADQFSRLADDNLWQEVEVSDELFMLMASW